MSVIIHIGYPKTASTWFQEMYFPKVENFDYLVDRWLFYKLFFESDSFLFDSAFTRNLISKSIAKENFILSSEQLTTSLTFGWHSGNYSIACANKLKKTYPGATIVIFIRSSNRLFVPPISSTSKTEGHSVLKSGYTPAKFFPLSIFFLIS
jgi:hypothetical protein